MSHYTMYKWAYPWSDSYSPDDDVMYGVQIILNVCMTEPDESQIVSYKYIQAASPIRQNGSNTRSKDALLK